MDSVNDKRDYHQLFEQMGIRYEELPKSYNPDSYARSLLNHVVKRSEISYAASTTIIAMGRHEEK